MESSNIQVANEIADRWDGTTVRRASALTAGMKSPDVQELRKMVMTARRDIGWLLSRLENYVLQDTEPTGTKQQGPSTVADRKSP